MQSIYIVSTKRVRYIFNYFYKYIELYCPICCLLKGHDNTHELNYISEENIIENKDTLFEESITDFESIYKKAKNRKQKIEEVIEGIEKMHKDVTDKLIKFFEDKHHNLNIKEKNAKKEIDEKAKEIKDELRKLLKESQDIILSCESISNSIQAFKQKSDTSNIKALYYISEISKNNEKANELFKKPLKNLNIILPNITLFSDEYKPTFNCYYITRVAAPKNISITKLNEQAFITWDIDEIKFQYKTIKFSVEIKEDGNENNISFIVDKHDMLFKYKNDTNYEVKIRAIIDGSFGEYSEIKTFNEKILDNFSFKFVSSFNNTGLFSKK